MFACSSDYVSSNLCQKVLKSRIVESFNDHAKALKSRILHLPTSYKTICKLCAPSSGKVKHKTGVNQDYPNLQYPTQHIHKRSQSSGIRRSSTANLRGSSKSRSSRAYTKVKLICKDINFSQKTLKTL